MKDNRETMPTDGTRIVGVITGTALVSVPMKHDFLKTGWHPADAYAAYVTTAVRETMTKYGVAPERISVSMRFDDNS